MAEDFSDFVNRFSANSIEEINAQTWDLLIKVLNTRFNALEKVIPPLEGAEAELLSVGLSRINDTLAPAVNTLTQLLDLGALFEADSETEVVVAEGPTTFVIVASQRAPFAPASQLIITTPDDEDATMWAKKISYNRDTGELLVDVQATLGEGTFSNWHVALAITPDIIPPGAILKDGPVSFQSYVDIALTANGNNMAPTDYDEKSVWRLSGNAGWSITGIVAAEPWQVLILHNVGTNNITLKNEDTGSLAANRFILEDHVVVKPKNSAIVQYDSVTKRWRLLQIVTSAGGGGSGVWTVSSSPPDNPLNGEGWFDLDGGLAYLYVDDGTSMQWVPVGIAGGTYDNFTRASVACALYGGL